MGKIIKIFAVLLLLVTVIAAGGVFYFFSLLKPVDSASTDKVRFVVAKGDSETKVGQKLSQAGLIKHPLIFRYARIGVDDALQAGSFELSKSMTPTQIALELTKGTNDMWVTFLEGWRSEEYASYLADSDLEEFDKAAFLTAIKDQEGYLFPDTYLVPKTATAESIARLLRDTFEKKVEKGLAKEIAASGRSLPELVTMASLIQREAKDPEQMKLVSGVLWKRIAQGMGLDVDCTLQYIQGYSPTLKTWWAPPSTATKQSTSLYNTYKYAGLPPGPISNPGMDALRASLTPSTSNNLFYLHDAQGRIHFAATLDQHNRNIQQYLR